MKRYTIFLTRQCNCRCDYCYQDEYETDYSWEDIKPILESIVKENDIYNIEFIGGEPFLKFDLLKNAYEYLEKYGNVNIYYISTNGTILNEEIIEWIKSHKNIILSISFDGKKQMNSLRKFNNGKESYNKVIENIKTLIGCGLQKRIMVHIVTHPRNVQNLCDGILYIYNLGVSMIDVGIVEKTMKINKEFCLFFINEHIKISKLLKNKQLNLIVTTLEYSPIDTNNKSNTNDLINILRKIVYENHRKIMKRRKNK